MTSLEEHTGRPDIEPWLRGWVNDLPQTTLIWRAHLPVRRRGAAATTREIEAFFEAAPPHVSEGLESETFRVRQWLVKRCETVTRRESEPVVDDAQPTSRLQKYRPTNKGRAWLAGRRFR